MCCGLVMLATLHSLLSTGAPQPNILFIMADDLGYEDLGFQGSDILTPNIDRLARQGVVLENHYVMPLCAPSRASFLTGRHAIRTGFWYGNMSPYAEWGLDTEETTIAQMLKSHGYSTHLIGKWHQGMSTWEMTPVKRGFDTFLGQYQGSGDYFSHQVQNAYDMREDYYREGVLVDDIRGDLNGSYSTHIYTNRTIELIEKSSNSSVPWFMFLSFTAPHKQYMAPKEDVRRYSSHMIYSAQDRKRYGTMISILDSGVGRIEAALERAGVRDNTLIVFTSDNGAVVEGGGSNYPLKGGKKTFYEGGVRAVSFVNSPLLKKTGYVNRNIHHIVDWFPTFEYLASSSGKSSRAVPVQGSRGIDGTNIWLSLCNDVRIRNHVLINMAQNVKIDDETEAADETDNQLKTTPPRPMNFLLEGGVMNFQESNQINHQEDGTILRGNAIFVFRWYYWKLILGEVGRESRSSSKNLQDVSPPDSVNSNKTYVRLFDYENIKRVQLYNIHKDPGERVNLAEDNPSVVRIIAKKLLSYVKAIKPLGRRTYATTVDQRKNGVWMPWRNSTDQNDVNNET